MNFFSTILYSIRKSTKLRKLQSALANIPLPQDVSALISWSEKRENLLSEYVDFCLADPGVFKVMKDFNITKKDIKEIYNQLLASGAGQWQGGHYVALSTLAYAQPLEYFLKAKKNHKSDLEIMYNLTVYFEKGMNQNLLKKQLVERVKKSRGFWEKFWKSME